VTRAEVSQEEKGKVLLALARFTLADALSQPTGPCPDAAWLEEPGACFVTLHRDGDLRGCIGSMIAYRSLSEDLQANARAAAFRDPRFPPLEAWELADLRIEVSLLSSLEPMEFESEEDLLRQLRPGIDGLLLEYGGHRGTFLPAVWRNLSRPEVFLGKLKLKAGLEQGFWAPGIEVKRYVTHSWSEADPAL
jgi:AmmeMemoRadiSam system protein A